MAMVWSGDKMAAARAKKGLTLLQLANELKSRGWNAASRQYLSDIEHGQHCPSLERAVLLADALGVAVEDLLSRGRKPVVL